MKYIKLNNNLEIPLIGIGTNTFGKVDNQYAAEINYDTKELDTAIQVGYRLLDTAIAYRNEEVIGLAVEKSGIKRSDFILITKLPGQVGYIQKNEIIDAVNQSLKNLKTNYIDILLMHHPWDNNEEMLSVYQVLEEFVKKGIIKTIGVSNFNNEQLKYILDHCQIKPAINQIASYPGHWQDDLIEFNQTNGIVVQAWSPLNRVTFEMKNILQDIGKKHDKTWAQVILNYQVRRGVVVIPKSHRLEGQKENLDIFDFELSPEDINRIKNL